MITWRETSSNIYINKTCSRGFKCAFKHTTHLILEYSLSDCRIGPDWSIQMTRWCIMEGDWLCLLWREQKCGFTVHIEKKPLHVGMEILLPLVDINWKSQPFIGKKGGRFLSWGEDCFAGEEMISSIHYRPLTEGQTTPPPLLAWQLAIVIGKRAVLFVVLFMPWYFYGNVHLFRNWYGWWESWLQQENLTGWQGKPRKTYETEFEHDHGERLV